MSKQQIAVTVDEGLKTEAEALFERLGLDISTAVNIFLHKVVAEGGMPFAITLPSDHAEGASATVSLGKEDERWLEKVPISPYPINRSRLAAMINMVYYYTHNVGKKIVSPNDVWKIFRDNGYIAYDAESDSKYILSTAGEEMLELKNGKNLLVKEEGQRYIIAHLRANSESKKKKKKRNRA